MKIHTVMLKCSIKDFGSALEYQLALVFVVTMKNQILTEIAYYILHRIATGAYILTTT